MSRHSSPEARVISFFEEAPLENAEMLLGIVRDRIKRRISAATIAGERSATVKRRARRTKVNAKPNAHNALEGRHDITEVSS